MGYLQKIATLKDEVARNPNVGTWSWLLHRLSGIALALYVFPHFWVISSAILVKPGDPTGFNDRLALVQSEFFHIVEIGLIGVIFYHMLNGIRVTLVDFSPTTRYHKLLLGIAMVVFLGAMFYTLYVFNHHYFHLFGMGGGGHAVP
jgi:succinate dehydrogenase / fumarate reductase cytochrome b subunit